MQNRPYEKEFVKNRNWDGKTSAFRRRNAGQDQGAQILSVGRTAHTAPKKILAKEEAQSRNIGLFTKLFILKKYTTTSDHTEGFFGKNDADNTISEHAGIVVKQRQNQHFGVSSGLKQQHQPSFYTVDSMR